MLPALLLPLFAFAATAVASPLKRDIYTIHDYVSVGHEGKCLKDSVHERILSKDYYGDHEHMTHESCAEFCSSRSCLWKSSVARLKLTCCVAKKATLAATIPLESSSQSSVSSSSYYGHGLTDAHSFDTSGQECFCVSSTIT
jgi:hypothetical protein